MSSTATTGLATIGQSHRYLSVSRTKLYDLMRKGELSFIRVGERRKIRWAELHRVAGEMAAEQ